jgi:hypothetical protein
VIVLEKWHKDEAQRAQLGAVQTQLEHEMTLKVRGPKSLNFQRRDKLDKMFPENCPPDASQSCKMRQLEATYWRSENRADARLASNYSQWSARDGQECGKPSSVVVSGDPVLQ